jgi:hypothetical protein
MAIMWPARSGVWEHAHSGDTARLVAVLRRRDDDVLFTEGLVEVQCMCRARSRGPACNEVKGRWEGRAHQLWGDIPTMVTGEEDGKVR